MLAINGLSLGANFNVLNSLNTSSKEQELYSYTVQSTDIFIPLIVLKETKINLLSEFQYISW